MKLLLAVVALAVCIGCKTVQTGPTPGLAYPWTNWLALRPAPPLPLFPPSAYSPFFAPPGAAAPFGGAGAGAPGASDEATADALANYLIARSILPAAPSKKKESKKEETPTDEPTTKKPKLIEVGDFWAPPSVAPNVTSPLVVDPAFWAAKKTMFISKLFAALAKQVLNSTGTVTTTTPNPSTALLKEIDTVLLSDAARSVVGAGPAAAGPPSAAAAKEAKKAAKKEKAKAAKTAAKAPKLPPWLAAKAKAAATTTTTTAAPEPEVSAEEEATVHPTLDYASLAKALLS